MSLPVSAPPLRRRRGNGKRFGAHADRLASQRSILTTGHTARRSVTGCELPTAPPGSSRS